MMNEMTFGERVFLATTGEYIGTYVGVSREDDSMVCVLNGSTGEVTHMNRTDITTFADDIVSSPEAQEIRAKVYAEQRSHFAAAALNGLLSHHGFSEEKDVDVERAILYADIMVRELSKR